MFHITLFFYQLVGILFSLIIPAAMILGLLWILAKMGKGFTNSIRK